MPKEFIDLRELMKKIRSNEIKKDKPLLIFGEEGEKFYVFQDSGLNMLLGQPGNGKTKFITGVIIELLKRIKESEYRYYDYTIVYIDTERPESQYAFNIEQIVTKCGLSEDDIFENLRFISTLDLNGAETKSALKEFLKRNKPKKCIIIIDHALSLVNDMNNLQEANEIDLLFKMYISEGHIILTSMHSTYNGMQKGMGHLGSAFDRGASFILEIVNSDDGEGFTLKNVKSRIASKSKKEMTMFKDKDGNIDLSISPHISEITGKSKPEDKSASIPEIVYLFARATIRTKKELYSIINNKFGFTDDSSSASTFYKKFLTDYIVFENGSPYFTDKGKAFTNKDI